MNINIPTMWEFKQWYIEKFGEPIDRSWEWLYTEFMEDYLNDI